MARPKVARITKSNVAAVALSIIDTEGPERLTLTRLAEHLGVNHASLYHHYRSKDEILDDVVRLALREVDPPLDSPDIVESLVENALSYRRMLQRHPNLPPLMGDWRRRRIRGYGDALDGLMHHGIRRADAQMILEAAEALAMGFAAFAAPDGGVEPDRSELERFEFCFRAMLVALVSELSH